MSNRRVAATLHRRTARSNLEREQVWARSYSYFDTAMPRAVQLLMSSGLAGDCVEFHSIEFGFSLGSLFMTNDRRLALVMSDVAKASPSLMKLMQEAK